MCRDTQSEQEMACTLTYRFQNRFDDEPDFFVGYVLDSLLDDVVAVYVVGTTEHMAVDLSHQDLGHTRVQVLDGCLHNAAAVDVHAQSKHVSSHLLSDSVALLGRGVSYNHL